MQDKDTDWLIVCTGNESFEVLEDFFGLGFLVLSVAEKAVSPRLGLLNPIRWRVKSKNCKALTSVASCSLDRILLNLPAVIISMSMTRFSVSIGSRRS